MITDIKLNEETDLQFENRFFSKVDFTGENECWNWIAGTNKDGYGVIGTKERSMLAHRVSYLYFFGYIPEGLYILHFCDNSSCINPEHLFPGTHNDNAQDMVLKNRQLKGEDILLSKLIKSQIIEIRKLYRENRNKKFTEGRLSCAMLADMFNVAHYTIWQIVNNKTWRHLI